MNYHLGIPPQAMRGMSFEERWELHVEYTETCWLWKGRLNKGYGYIRKDGKVQRAHVVAYVMKYGSVPPGKEVHHKCNVRSCVRPSHLKAVTHLQNVQAGKGWRTKYPHSEDTRVKLKIQARSRRRDKAGRFDVEVPV